MLQPLAAQKRGKTFGLRSLGATFFRASSLQAHRKSGSEFEFLSWLHLVTFHSNVAGETHSSSLGGLLRRMGGGVSPRSVRQVAKEEGSYERNW